MTQENAEPMNVLFLTQANSLRLFYGVAQAMESQADLDKIGFYAADSQFFEKFKEGHPDIESRYQFLKEWEIVDASSQETSDLSLLGDYEKRIGDPILWNALVADRRIFFGKRFAYAKDYSPRYSHDKMLAILQCGLKNMEMFFEQLSPDFVVNFQCNTLGDYLGYLFAKSKGVPFLNLRPTRIQNYFFAGESVLEPSEQMKQAYERLLSGAQDGELIQEARDYLHKIQETHAMYEGVVRPSEKPPSSGKVSVKRPKKSKISGLVRLLKDEYSYRFGSLGKDNHVAGVIGPLLWRKTRRPWRARAMDREFRDTYVRHEDLGKFRYAFYPLHTEPEVTLSVYSNSYLNQIEVARLFSHNLPVGMKLVVKEHPWEIGKRPVSYYRKLLQIPNLLLAHPAMGSREIVLNADLITVVAGSVGLEGLMLKKPVVTLGGAPFNFMPRTMIRHVREPSRLGFEIRELLGCYEFDERVIISYIAAIMQESVPVDFYTRLLGRKGAYNPSGFVEEEVDLERQEHTNRLARYLIQQYRSRTANVEHGIGIGSGG